MGTGAVTPDTIKRETNSYRDSIFYYFGDKLAGSRVSCHATPDKECQVRVTRYSAVNDGEDWVINMDAADCRITDIRYLDRYCLEHIFTLEEKTNVLLFASVDNDDTVTKGAGEAVHQHQGNKPIILGIPCFRF